MLSRPLATAFFAIGMSLAGIAAPDPKIEYAMANRKAARDLAHRGRFDQAIEKLELGARRAPRTEEGAACRFDCARLYHIRRDPIEAFEQYQILLNDFPNSAYTAQAFDAQFDIADTVTTTARRAARGQISEEERRKLPKADRIEQMLRLLVTNAGQHPRAPKARYLLGVFLSQSERLQEAIDVFDQLADLHPRDELADDASFQVAILNWRLIGGGQDQEAMRKTMYALADFLARYPESDRVAEAAHRLAWLEEKEVRTLENIAAYYARVNKPEAVEFYTREASRLRAARSPDLGPPVPPGFLPLPDDLPMLDDPDAGFLPPNEPGVPQSGAGEAAPPAAAQPEPPADGQPAQPLEP